MLLGVLCTCTKVDLRRNMTSFTRYLHTKTNTFEIAIDPPDSNKYLLTFRGIECGIERNGAMHLPACMKNSRIFKIDSRP